MKLEVQTAERGEGLRDLVSEILKRHQLQEGALLPILHAVQGAVGYIPDGAVPMIAEGLNLSRAEVHGVLTFYVDFRRSKPGRRIVKLCRAEACQARGGGHAFEAAVEARLGVRLGETRRDGEVTLEGVYCLGLCGIGPAALVDGRPVALMSGAGVERLAEEVGV